MDNDRIVKGHKKRFKTLTKRYGKDHMSNLARFRWDKEKAEKVTEKKVATTRKVAL